MKIIKEKDFLGGDYYMIHTEDIRSKFDLCIEEVNNFEAFCCSYMTEPYFMYRYYGVDRAGAHSSA